MTDGVEGSSSSRIRGIRAADTALADRIQVKQTTPICWHISEYRAGNRLYGLIKDERVKANGNKHDRMSVAYPIRPFIVARQKPSICPNKTSQFVSRLQHGHPIKDGRPCHQRLPPIKA